MTASTRRRVDWSFIGGPAAEGPTLGESSGSELGAIVAAVEALLAHDDVDRVLRGVVELCRDVIGFERAAIFLLDRAAGTMLGTWGTGLAGETVDEHDVMYALGPSDGQAFERAERGVAPYTVFLDCPLVVHLPTETRRIGTGWVVCTPIRAERGPVGMLFNDGGPAGRALDERKQAVGALVCSMLGPLVELARGAVLPEAAGAGLSVSARHPKIVEAVRLLSAEPALESAELAARVGWPAQRLSRAFRKELGVSLVEYRNKLRLERFFALVQQSGDDFLGAALAAGFGSYAQFHRVFRQSFGASPREYLRPTQSKSSSARSAKAST